MKKNIKKVLALLFATIIFAGGFGNVGRTEAAVNNVTSITDQAVASGAVAGQQTNIQDGVTLHCWNWSYKNIEANMELIAASGYTAIQTSPIQQSKEGTKTYSMDAWWLYYQPMGFHIDNTGNSALGTKAEFESMCKTAHKYGVKVIVDIVANHTGNQTDLNISSAVSADLREDSSCWHYQYGKFMNTSNWNSRYEVTQLCMNGIPDLNTSNLKVQSYVIGLLKECIDAGADGFRFDAAKHIELPSTIDTDSCGSDFWPNVINAATNYATQKGKSIYCYGELLDSPGGDVPAGAYTTYMSITDNSWSNTLRHNVSSGDASKYDYAYHKDGNGVPASKLVLWAESHDTFASGESKDVHIDNINKTWALVAARADAMSLYFARPSSTNLNNVPMGTACVTGWSDVEVREVNKFHNAFVGQTEYVAKENGIAYCERGNTGVVLVSCGENSVQVNVKANQMEAGTYIDQITGNTFTVANGRITGKIGDRGIAVVYNTTSSSTAKTNVAYIELPSGWGTDVKCYVYGSDGSNNGEWPGVKMTKVSGNLYKYEVPSNINNPRVIFYSSNSNRYPADLQPGLSLYGEMIYKNGIWSAYGTNTSQDNSGSGNTGNGGSGSNDTGNGGLGSNDTGNGGSGSNDTGNGGSGSNDTGNGGSGSGNTGNGGSGSNDTGNGNTGNNDSGTDTETPGTDVDDKDDASNETTADDDQNSGNEDNNIEESPEKETGKDTAAEESDGKDDSVITIGPSPTDENGSVIDDQNNGGDSKKFPWPAVVIPIVVLGIGAGVFVYIKGNKVPKNNE